jgi:carbamoyltransferase
MKDEINAAVKYREAFRPFAPAVLEESAVSYFDIPDGQRVPFMERVFAVKPEYQSTLAAVTHADGSARLQTVSKQSNPRFWKLIEEFGKLVGVPVLLNTSFNLNGEPIVSSPTDALHTFYSCGLDYLVLGDFMVAKV